MIPIETRDRILAALPDYFRLIAPDGSRRQYTVSKWWSYEDHESDYPELVVDPLSEAVTRTADTPADDSLGKVRSPSDPNTMVDRYTGRRLLDEWTITCVTRGDSGGVSQNARADIFAATVYDWILRRGHALNTPGTTNQIPVILDCLDGVTNTSGMDDDTLVSRRSFSVQLKYASAVTDSAEYVAGYEGSARSGEGGEAFFSVSADQ